jgi:transposase
MPAAHPPEFRERAVELAFERAKPIAQIARDLGISESCLRRWMSQADVDAGRREGVTTEERRELVKLRRENRTLAMENEVSNGVVYVASGGLYAFDAAGVTNCSGTPKTCTPLWTVATSGATYASPAVADGVVYFSSVLYEFYAVDAARATNCSGVPKTCAPLWSFSTEDSFINSSPAVANGVVYFGSEAGQVYGLDAAGVSNCSGIPKECCPLWASSPGGFSVGSSPTVVNGFIYFGTGALTPSKIYAYHLP